MATTLTAPTSLVSELQSRGVPDVRVDPTSRATYSSDASLYRVKPTAVVFPRHLDEVLATLEVCRERGIPFTSRGAGTSLAGNSIGAGVVIDFSRHLNRVLDFDAETRTAVVEPGAVHATLQKVALTHGLRFGPDPSTHTRCTVGGMIGNNACGSRALAYGRTADNVTHLDVVTGSGTRLYLGADGTPSSPETEALRSLVGAELGTIRTELGRFGRQVSGYSLEHLLPERGFDLRRALVGSEGTLAVVLEAGVRLVADAPHKTMVVLGFGTIGDAGDAVTSVLPFRPTACEGLDSRIVEVVRSRKGPQAVPELPGGAAWLFVEISGDDAVDVADRAGRLSAIEQARHARIITDPREALALWRIREDGGGLAGRSPAGAPAHAGWEDAAVPPERLGDYLREFDDLLLTHQLTGFPFGHFGDGCVHIRLDFPLGHDGTTVFRAFLTDAAKLVARYGGSLSGEHGDGRARSELLPYMYSPAAISLFGKVKGILDPDNILNPGILVNPEPLDANVRVAEAGPLRSKLGFGYLHDDGDFSQAVHRCTGVGLCRASHADNSSVMCPSYLATREEKDSTRGRARVLQEMINGSVTGGTTGGKPNWRAPEVHDALDLCLSCKGCASDCPTGIDMAAYKAEVLHQSHKGRIRPASHYSLGWLPRWAKLAAFAPRLVNALVRLPGVRQLGLRLAGVDQRRSIPAFAPQTFHSWFTKWAAASAGTSVSAGTSAKNRPQVLLWADSFTNNFSPEVGQSAVRVLEAAGYEVLIPDAPVCCGLTWISTGQLDAARKILRSSVTVLGESVDQGIPIVGLEPSCTGVLRSDAVELLGHATAGRVAEATHTLAEFLAKAPGYTPPSLDGTTVVAQPHCHHHAVMGWSPDAALLEGAGATLQKLGGCCGLAGNFGVERGHYDISVAVAEQQLLPAVRGAAGDAVVLADGFSCRTQLEDLSERRGIHLAQLLDPGQPEG